MHGAVMEWIWVNQKVIPMAVFGEMSTVDGTIMWSGFSTMVTLSNCGGVEDL
jgi:hypothetical protein